jgi:hypothetical protein
MTTGTDVVRAALAAHAKRSLNLATTAKDLGVPAETLLSFVERGKPLAPSVMAGLVKILFHGHAELGVDDLLHPAKREPIKVIGAARPPPYVKPPGEPSATAPRLGPQPVKPMAPRAGPCRR